MAKRRKQQATKEALQHIQIHRLSRQLAQYEGARDSRRTSGWYTPLGGPNSDIKSAWRNLVRRHQDLVDNEPWAKKAIGVTQHNWIGDGIISSPIAATKRYAGMWEDWSSGTDCDFYGRANLWSLQSQVARTTAVRGACLIRRRPAPELLERGLAPLQIQVLEPDWLDFEKDDGNLIQFGQQFDELGRLVGYWIRTGHPGESSLISTRGVSEFVPAKDCLLHFETLRPGQRMGVPFGAAALLALRDIGDIRTAQLMKDKIAASFCAFVTDSDPESTDLSGGEIIDSLKPGAVEILPPGKTIEMAVPPGAGDFVQTEREYLYSVAAAYEVPFWSMTGILSEVNFSSMRGDWLEFNRRLSHLRWNVTIPQMCAPVCRWHDEAAQMAQMLKGPMRWTHTPPRREMIQPKEEIPALIEAMQAGMMSLQEVQRSYGWVPRQVLEELSADKKMAEELDLNLSVFLPDPPDAPDTPDAEMPPS